jgi:MFS family permease
MPWPRALRSLSNRNLRLFFAGQSVSLVGSWMQNVAQGWLVYRLTQSATLLGTAGFLSQLPAFLFGLWAGSIADRVPRRRIILATQVNALLQATLLAVLTLSGSVRPWHILALGFLLGVSHAFEIPARQSLLVDIAGREDMSNAIALNSTIFNLARAVGPGIAGWTVAAVGEGWCFALNALSFAGTIYALSAMRFDEEPRKAPASQRAHLMDGIAYAARTPYLRALLATLASSALLVMPFSTFLPLIAKDVLGGDARLLGYLQGAAGVGALTAGVLLMLRGGITGLGRRVALGTTLLGVGVAGLALSRTPALSALALAVAGFGMVTQAAGTMTLMHSLAPPEMRGRLAGLFSTMFMGFTPFGALGAGFAAQRFGATRVLLVGAIVVLGVSVGLHAALPRLRKALAADPAASRPAAIP